MKNICLTVLFGVNREYYNFCVSAKKCYSDFEICEIIVDVRTEKISYEIYSKHRSAAYDSWQW